MAECGGKTESREQRTGLCEGDILQAIGSFTWLFFWRRYPAVVVQYLACEKPSKWNANEYKSYLLDDEVSFPHIIHKSELQYLYWIVDEWDEPHASLAARESESLSSANRVPAKRLRSDGIGSAEPPISLEYIPFVDKDVNDIEISTQTVSTASCSLSLCSSSTILYSPRMLSIAGQSKHSEILAHQSPTSQTCRNDHSSNNAR